jgi:hypothetical protein
MHQNKLAIRKAVREGRRKKVSGVGEVLHPKEVLHSYTGPEVKVVDLFQNQTSITSAGTIQNLSAMTQGVAQSQRVGDRCSLEAMALKYCFYPNSTNGNAVRIVLFQWLQNNSVTVPTSALVLQYNTVAYASLAPYQFTGAKDELFAIVYDKLHSIDPGSSPAIGQAEISLKGRDVSFDQAATTGIGHIYSLIISDAAASAPTFSCTTRLLYRDA